MEKLRLKWVDLKAGDVLFFKNKMSFNVRDDSFFMLVLEQILEEHLLRVLIPTVVDGSQYQKIYYNFWDSLKENGLKVSDNIVVL